MKTKRILALLLAMTMIFALAFGCAKDAGSAESPSGSPSAPAGQKPDASAPPAGPTAAESSDANDPGKGVYTLPLAKEPTYFSVFQGFNPQMEGIAPDPGEGPVDMKYKELTNIYFNYVTFHPSVQKEQFNLMLTSGDVCDTFAQANTSYPGGWSGLFEDGVIYDLSDMIKNYAPNYDVIRNSTADIKVSTQLADGSIPAFALLYKEPTSVGFGLMIRKDWVQALGIDMPKTYEEYYNFLKLAKDKYNATMWLPATGTFYDSAFASGFGAAVSATSGRASELSVFAINNGQVECSLLTDGFKQYIELMNKWYGEGLIFTDFVSGDIGNVFCNNSQNNVDKVFNSEFSVWMAMTENFIDYESMFTEPGVDVSAAYYPVQKAGDKYGIGYYYCNFNSWGASISTTCPEEKAILLVKYNDFKYSEMGSDLSFWGIEGTSWEYDKDGNKQFTDLILKNPDGFNIRQAFAIYGGGSSNYYDLQDYYAHTYPASGLEAESIWTSNYTQDATYPSLIITFSDDESATQNRYVSDLITYIQECIPRFITGDMALSEMETFKKTLKDLHVDDVLKTYQSAYDRYKAAVSAA